MSTGEITVQLGLYPLNHGRAIDYYKHPCKSSQSILLESATVRIIPQGKDYLLIFRTPKTVRLSKTSGFITFLESKIKWSEIVLLTKFAARNFTNYETAYASVVNYLSNEMPECPPIAAVYGPLYHDYCNRSINPSRRTEIILPTTLGFLFGFNTVNPKKHVLKHATGFIPLSFQCRVNLQKFTDVPRIGSNRTSKRLDQFSKEMIGFGLMYAFISSALERQFFTPELAQIINKWTQPKTITMSLHKYLEGFEHLAFASHAVVEEEVKNLLRQYVPAAAEDLQYDVQVVSGFAIRDVYASKDFPESCMTLKSRLQKINLYAVNPNVVRLITLKLKLHDTIISTSRALVFKAEDGRTILDRIYTTRDPFQANYSSTVRNAINNLQTVIDVGIGQAMLKAAKTAFDDNAEVICMTSSHGLSSYNTGYSTAGQKDIRKNTVPYFILNMSPEKDIPYLDNMVYRLPMGIPFSQIDHILCTPKNIGYPHAFHSYPVIHNNVVYTTGIGATAGCTGPMYMDSSVGYAFDTKNNTLCKVNCKNIIHATDAKGITWSISKPLVEAPTAYLSLVLQSDGKLVAVSNKTWNSRMYCDYLTSYSAVLNNTLVSAYQKLTNNPHSKLTTYIYNDKNLGLGPLFWNTVAEINNLTTFDGVCDFFKELESQVKRIVDDSEDVGVSVARAIKKICHYIDEYNSQSKDINEDFTEKVKQYVSKYVSIYNTQGVSGIHPATFAEEHVERSERELQCAGSV